MTLVGEGGLGSRDPIMIKNCSARAYLLRLAAIINEAESDCPGP